MSKISTYAFIAIMGMSVFVACEQPTSKATAKTSKQQRIEDALKDNFERTKDLDLGYPPIERMAKAIKQTQQIQQQLALTKSNFTNVRFRERGPNNIGGRTRTILIDQNDPTRKTIFAGGVSGGLWKTDDITAPDPQWQKINDFLDNLSIGALAQDVNNPQIMYLGTGEGYGTGIVGLGLFKSVDAGKTWELLPTASDGRFRFTRSLLIHPSGDIYAGTATGLYRSQDEGQTWESVFGGGGVLGNGIYDIIYIESNNAIYVSTEVAVAKSVSGDRNDWESVKGSGYPSGWSRTELAVSPSNPSIMYILGSISGRASDVYKTTDGGANWQRMGKVAGLEDFTNGQAWYDLEIAVDPFNPQHIIAGGVPIFRSLNGGFSWDSFAAGMHVDHHVVVFDKKQSGIIYFGNDGGIYRSENSSGRSIQNRNLGYNVTQFYSCALHPDTFSNYMLGGTQDNNSLQLNENGISGARIVNGDDGMLCHIDQNEPQYQVVSSQFGNYALTTDGGVSFAGGAFVNGSFVNPSDYDDEANILYTQTFDADFSRWQIPSGTPELVNISNADLQVSFVYADPSTSNRIYLGTFDGDVYRIDDAQSGSSLDADRLVAANRGVVSSIAVQKDDSDHILVTYSNYGLPNSIVESRDGGSTWINVEGNLPDMPVRAVLFGPKGGEIAIIGTEAGVWFTEKLNGESTNWIPPMPGRGIPLVRTDDLQMRESDNIILAATHGRGLFTSDVFAAPNAKLSIDKIGYVDAPILFSGAASTGADTYFWDFGDGTNSRGEEEVHSYSEIGSYNVQLTVNDTLSDNATIKILPNKTLPYKRRADGYSGDFDSRPEDYGVYTISGSAFERGSSSFLGKDGTLSGDNAFVLGKNEQFYQPNTHTMLYLPNFDFSEESIYEFSFWAKHFLQDGFDGFLVEYSTNKGQDWKILGQEQDNWYDFTNSNNLQGAAFPNGTPYFGRSRSSFTQFYIDISFLAGQSDVAFRFVFRSNGVGNHPGLVIDDVEVKRYEGELQTAIVALKADYSSAEEIAISWTTQPEYYAQEFIVERSLNGRDFEEIEDTDPTGIITSRVQNYEIKTLGIRDLYFYRIRSINESKSRNYFYEFTTPTIVVRRNLEDVEVFKAFPNPFSDAINLTFTNVVQEPLDLELFDSAGRLILKEQRIVEDVYTRWELPELASGVYFLRYVLGDSAAKTIKLSRF